MKIDNVALGELNSIDIVQHEAISNSNFLSIFDSWKIKDELRHILNTANFIEGSKQSVILNHVVATLLCFSFKIKINLKKSPSFIRFIKNLKQK